ncbi:eukaryotic translation initiation factor 2A [Sitodiplosis mosellana]|uniref:eukaryotic translation initiation factor 2A n=1 Tax=Sitodiplosis mosellana TaxID=263140 RepID=UPI002444EC85|nr:eukaryotic translation initiation factor 2A [Sitodiplosis mosellana]
MATDGISPALAIRSSVGVELWHSAGANNTYTTNEKFARDESKFCRAIEFSGDGRYLAWANGTKVQIASVNNWNVICSLPRPKAFAIKFSPKGTYLATLEHYSTPKDGSEPHPNFCVYRVSTSEAVFAIINKNFPDDWMPGWSSDEGVFALMVGGEAFFYETNGPDGFQKSANKIGGSRGGELSIAGGGSNPQVALYVPGQKGQPSICKIFRYPALDANQIIASKSFYQADRVEMMWNKRASGMILMTSTDVDATGASYYGKQALYFMSTKGDSCSVPLSKEGPIHAVQWSPKGNEFCVIYGYMPSKATFFNLKCDPVFEVKEAARNSIYYNPFGNIVLLAGFGNLRGSVEVWDANEKKLITTFQAADSTLLEWGPDGENLVTATTAPRLRIGNGFKVWHYSGALLHETVWPTGQELLQVCWQRFADGLFTEKPISNVKVAGIQPSQPQSSKAVYVPPNIRSGGGSAISSAGVSQRPNQPPVERGPIPGLPIGYKVSQGQRKKDRNAKRKENENPKQNITSNSSANSNATKVEGNSPQTNPNQANPTSNNKRNQRRTPRQPNNQNHTNGNSSNIQNISDSTPTPNSNANTNVNVTNNSNTTLPNEEQPIANGSEAQKRERRPRNRQRKSEGGVGGTLGDPEKDKRMRTVQQKLRDIAKLKVRRDNGDNLEVNQLSKIGLEAELIKELNSLKVEA